MMATEDNLQTTYNELKRAIDDYNAAYQATIASFPNYSGPPVGRYDGPSFDVAARRYEMREKAFNREVSEAIKATGEAPTLAEDMLYHQRWNGFHAKGLAKIIGDYHRAVAPDTATATASGVDAMTLPAVTDLKESWYGIDIDKKKYRIVLEDETEDSVYLKIVKKQTP